MNEILAWVEKHKWIIIRIILTLIYLNNFLNIYENDINSLLIIIIKTIIFE